MKSNAAPKKTAPVKRSEQKKNSVDKVAEPKAVDRHSSEAIALHLLDPSVSAQEETEYQGSVVVSF